MVEIGYASKANHPDNNGSRLKEIVREFQEGYKLLETIGRAVTIFGSSRTKQGDRMYQEARQLARWLAEHDHTIVTGGGPGIMAAANRGAVEGGGRSIGFNIMLKNEREQQNQWVKESVRFYYFYVRKVMLASAAEAYVYFPGGFGTMDEFFEISTLVETHKLHKDVPIVLVGKDYWQPLLDWLKNTAAGKYGAFDAKDFRMWFLVDTAEEAFRVIEDCEDGSKLCPWVSRKDHHA